ncbi:YraN family protein [Paenibacillus sp. y28]|uniref:YraN family protein n=1 Tax=Paenibacillus sp. y28 TaxID=3129110 RepID=UPI0030160D21
MSHRHKQADKPSSSSKEVLSVTAGSLKLDEAGKPEGRTVDSSRAPNPSGSGSACDSKSYNGAVKSKRQTPSTRPTRRPDPRKALGREGEERAARFLQEQGYTIAARNWRCRSGEIDIVATIGETIVFVEVRTRRTTGHFGTAAESVQPFKQQQVRGIAEIYLYQNRKLDAAVRFDVITVEVDPAGTLLQAELRHYESAF